MLFNCGIPGCTFTFTTGGEHLAHLKTNHDFVQNSSSDSIDISVIFQDPRQDYDVYISYCKENLTGKSGHISEFHDPQKITAELSKHFKPWFDSVSIEGEPTSDFYEHRALAIQNVKLVVALISPEYCQDETCKQEFEFAFKSLQKIVFPVYIKEGSIDDKIASFIKNGGRVPFRFDGKIENKAVFDERIQYLISAVRRLIEQGDLETQNVRMSYMNLGTSSQPGSSIPSQGGENVPPPTYEEFVSREQQKVQNTVQRGVPAPGDHVVSHHFKHAYYTATIVRFIRDSMSYEIAWDDGDPSGRFPPISLVALNKIPAAEEVFPGQKVLFPQGSYTGTEGNNSGGLRYHEGIITKVTGKHPKMVYHGHHTKGADDGKWITYRGYSYTFKVSLAQLRLAPNPYNILMAEQFTAAAATAPPQPSAPSA